MATEEEKENDEQRKMSGILKCLVGTDATTRKMLLLVYGQIQTLFSTFPKVAEHMFLQDKNSSINVHNDET